MSDTNIETLLVCGSRAIDDKHVVFASIRSSPWDPDELLHGGATGVDSFVSEFASREGLQCDVQPIPDWVWAEMADSAGPRRNAYMVEQADAVVAVWNGVSPGTENTINTAVVKGVPVHRVEVERHENRVWTVTDVELIEGTQQSLNDFAEQ